MVKMKILPEPTVKMNVGTEIIDMTEEDYEKAYSDGYDKGYSNGHSDGTADGVEQGKKAEYDAFWASQKANFESAASQASWFAGGGWDNTTFNPNFDIIPTKMATGLFRRNAYNGDLVALAERNGIVIDFSNAQDVTYLFYEASFTHIGVLDFRNAPSLTAVLGYAYYLQTIDKIILYENNTFNNVSFRCPSLKNITIEGTIGMDVNFQWSPLTPESMISVITHLANYAGTENEVKYSVLFNEPCWEALEAYSSAPDGGKWKNYVYNVLRWGY